MLKDLVFDYARRVGPRRTIGLILEGLHLAGFHGYADAIGTAIDDTDWIVEDEDKAYDSRKED